MYTSPRRSLPPAALKLPLAEPQAASQAASRAELAGRRAAPFRTVTAPAAPAQALHSPPAAPWWRSTVRVYVPLGSCTSQGLPRPGSLPRARAASSSRAAA